MCGSQCGVGIPSCSGTCITGKFWAIWFDTNDATGTNDANFDHIAIHDFPVVSPSLPDVDANYKYGFLGNVLATLPPADMCDPSSFEYCSPFDEI